MKYDLSSPSLLIVGGIALLIAFLVGPWLLSLVVNIFTKVVIWRKQRRYDPEKVICRCCGYRGDKRSAGKVAQLSFARVKEAEGAAIQCTCFRCGAVFYLPLFRPAKEWLANLSVEELKQTLQSQ